MYVCMLKFSGILKLMSSVDIDYIIYNLIYKNPEQSRKVKYSV